VPFLALTRSGIVFPIIAFLERRGAPVERLLARAGLAPGILTDPEGLVPTLSVARFLAETARAQGIPNLGLLSGEEARIDTLGVMGRLICGASTLGDALQAEVRNHRTFSSNGRIWLELHGAEARLCQAFTNGFDERWQQADHYLLMIMLSILRLGAGPTWRPAKVQLQTGECPMLRDAEALSAARIDFGRPVTIITFPRLLLGAPLRPPSNASGILEQSIHGWEASAPSGDFVGSMVQVVQTLSWEGYPHIRQTADVLGLSVRTLQRHLTAAGVSHESLIGRARLATAAALLDSSDAKVLDIALDLGYSDHAHFTRAFRRWTGRSPQEFRRERRTIMRPSTGLPRGSSSDFARIGNPNSA
jgi:AraC-like DNA-binding protein